MTDIERMHNLVDTQLSTKSSEIQMPPPRLLINGNASKDDDDEGEHNAIQSSSKSYQFN